MEQLGQSRRRFLALAAGTVATTAAGIGGALVATPANADSVTSAAQASPDRGAAPWPRVPAIRRRIRPPRFPRRVFSVTDHGAVGDGSTKCTEAFAQAVAACTAAGGGRVLVPEGTYLTGA